MPDWPPPARKRWNGALDWGREWGLERLRAQGLALEVVFFGLIIASAATVGLQFTFSGALSALWPPAGLAVAMVLRRGWWFLLSLWGGNFLAAILGSVPMLTALPLNLASVVEVALTVAVVRQWGRYDGRALSLRGMLALIGGALLIGCPVAASLVTTALALSTDLPQAPFLLHGAIWGLGDAVGILLLAPLLLFDHREITLPPSKPNPRHLTGFFALLSLTASGLTLRHWPDPLVEIGHALTYLLFPLVVLTALWLETLGVIVVIGLIAVLALFGNLHHLGPFSSPDPNLGLFRLQIFLVTLSTTGLCLAVVMTERRRATEAVKRNADRLAAAERLAGIGCWQYGSGESDRAWSAGMYHVFGLSPGTGIPPVGAFDERIAPEDRPALLQYRTTLGQNCDGEGIEIRLRLNSGAERWLICRHTAANESKTVFFGIVKDITTQIKHTKALYDSEQRLRHIFEQSPIGIGLVSHNLHFLKVNNALSRLTGYSRDELQALRVIDITHPDDLAQSLSGLPGLLSGEVDLFTTEKRYIRKDGVVVWINLSARPVRDVSGKTLYFVSMMEDTTERKRTEQALASAKQAAEQNSLAKTRFLVAASHDLRQPLLAANLFLDALEHRSGSAGRLPEFERLRQALTAMNELLDVLLDLTQIDAGTVRAEPRDIRLGRLLGDLSRTWSALATARGLSLRTVPCSLIAHTDPMLLKRIVRNLLDNAIKYTPQGRVLLGCRRFGNTVRIQVWDTGVGIPNDKLDAIFEEFYQVGNAHRDRRHGLGVGLSIVERLAAVLGHPLTVRSTPGRGSVFEVVVPLGRRNQPDTAPPAMVSSFPLVGVVAIIEDDALVLSALETTLAGWGCHVVAGATVNAVWAQLQQMTARPSLVLADFGLADGWTGVQAIEWLRAQLGTVVPGIILTGNVSDAARSTAEESGLPILHKPFTPDALRTLLKRSCKADKV